MKNVFRKTRFFLLFLAAGYGLWNSSSYAQAGGYIRVAILQNASALSLKVKGACQVLDSSGSEVLYRSSNLNTTVTAYKGGILIAGKSFNRRQVLVRSQDREPIIINSRLFNGDIGLMRKDDGSLLAINIIELEDYVKGILYHETSHYWPKEALRAQAIVSRTYAVYQIGENAGRDFDATADIYSQVYGGKNSERFRTNEAVEDTGGEVLMYKGKVIPAYFHATCGGHTEDASMLWNINIAALKGVICVFCKDSPHFRWHDTLPLAEIEKKLSAAGYNIKDIRSIVILGKDSSARITELKITSPEKDIKISAKDFRSIIGPNIIRSTNFQVYAANREAVFQGLGWGHGVGLCQWGAYFMAKQGYSYKDILRYYYPGAEVASI